MFVVGILIVVAGVLVSIALHEIGHLVPAKVFKVKVTQYMVGFGPTLWSRRRGETEYGVKAIPLGGYVRMVGMYPPARPEPAGGRQGRPGVFARIAEEAREASRVEVAPGEEGRAFYSLSVPKKVVVMAAGPAMNLLIAVVLLVVIFSGIGIPTLTSTLGAVADCVVPVTEPTRDCGPSDPVAPGAAAGLVPGDRVVGWGGEPVEDWAGLSSAIRASGTDAVEVVLVRDGTQQSVTVTPVTTERPVVEDGALVTDESGEPVLEPVPFVGVGPALEVVRQPLAAGLSATGDTVAQTAGIIATLPARMVEVGRAAFGDAEREDGVIGLIGVGRVAGELATVEADASTAAVRAASLLGIIASLNIALLLFNLVPLVPLDGGHVAGALWEGLRRQVARVRHRPDPGPVDAARAMPLAYVVVLVMVGMSLVLAYADLVNPVTL